MLPLTLLKTAQNHPMDGDKFWRMPECYIRGSTIKYLRIPDEVIDMVKEDIQMKSRGRGEMKGRGGQSQRGRGSGRGTFGRGGRGPAPLNRGGGTQVGNKSQNKPRPK
ncbi:u6 snrna-associated sm-like protein lsm4-like protein [Lasius niger]|uniref:U6 snrna-associated sm-like protein lsm4-like protein n=1 Tax=Lasius niger TaxID=67767 RepID=A0A0J7L095_LASNI|nr:u6 snrna-associated sm-like protein lsm4-like protein [Lasius niger]